METSFVLVSVYWREADELEIESVAPWTGDLKQGNGTSDFVRDGANG